MKGKLITVEGIDGTGKSTQAKYIVDYLRGVGKDVVFVRDPGGVPVSEKIREIVKNFNDGSISKTTEFLLYVAARAQLINDAIIPALEVGKIVVCDRFLDSTRAYQGYGNGTDMSVIFKLEKLILQGVKPDLTFLFDIEPEKSLHVGEKDRIESRTPEYHHRVRKGYLGIASENPKRVKIINVDASADEISKRIKIYLDMFFKINR